MKDYILLMHSDATQRVSPEAWPAYFAKLRDAGIFDGGSSTGAGEVVRRDRAARPSTDHVSGYIRVRAESLAAAKLLVEGNPVFECGGSIEIRELPRD